VGSNPTSGIRSREATGRLLLPGTRGAAGSFLARAMGIRDFSRAEQGMTHGGFMGRGAAARRRDSAGRTEGFPLVLAGTEADCEARCERLEGENARLREEIAEVQGWYVLLKVDHAALEKRHRQVGCKTAELQAEKDRLDVENRELRALAFAREGHGSDDTRGSGEVPLMARIFRHLNGLRKNRWAAAALVAIGTLLARDPIVREGAASVVSRVKRAANGGDESPRDTSAAGFVNYATMLDAREQAERARLDYNSNEAALKGDSLLEAQDRLRAAKARYRQARLAFLPELARHCERAGMPLPREASEALAALNAETRE